MINRKLLATLTAAVVALGAGTAADASVERLHFTGQLLGGDGAYQAGDSFAVDLEYDTGAATPFFDPSDDFSAWSVEYPFVVTVNGAGYSISSPMRVSYARYDSENAAQFMAQDSNSNVSITGLPKASAATVPTAAMLSHGTASTFFWTTSGRGWGYATLAPAVPEPATWAMMLVGLGAVGIARRRRPAEPVAA